MDNLEERIEALEKKVAKQSEQLVQLRAELNKKENKKHLFGFNPYDASNGGAKALKNK